MARPQRLRERSSFTRVLRERHPQSTPLDQDTTRQVIEDYSVWIVHAPTNASVLAATKFQQQRQVSFWDAIILESAQTLRAVALWSENLNVGQYFGDLEVKTPFAIC